MKSVLSCLLILPSTLTTTGQIDTRWISAISSYCTSRYVDGDDITRDRPGAKYLWLIYVRQRTKWVFRKLRDLDGSSAPFVIALKNNITNRMSTNFSFCKKHDSHSVTQYHTFYYLLPELLFLSRNREYYGGIEVMVRWFCTACINGFVIFVFSAYFFTSLLKI